MTVDEVIQEYQMVLADGFRSFECHQGWFALIARALAAMREASSTAKVLRVKEKLGTLRIRLTDPRDPVAAEIVHGAELESATVCEICGSEGALIISIGPARTRCPAHGHVW